MAVFERNSHFRGEKKNDKTRMRLSRTGVPSVIIKVKWSEIVSIRFKWTFNHCFPLFRIVAVQRGVKKSNYMLLVSITQSFFLLTSRFRVNAIDYEDLHRREKIEFFRSRGWPHVAVFKWDIWYGFRFRKNVFNDKKMEILTQLNYYNFILNFLNFRKRHNKV